MSGGAGDRLTALAFCGKLPWRLIRELAEGDEVVACYVVHEVRRAETRGGKPYLRLTLGDRTGTIDGYVWEEADRWEPICVIDSVIGVRGRVSSFQDRLQLKIDSVDPIAAEPADYELLLAASPRPRDQMERELDAFIESVRDPGLHALLRRCVGRETELGRAYRIHPAAQRNHHGYIAGLMEHSLSVATICDRLADHYCGQGVALDRDLLVTAALLHDIGKVRELRPPPGSGYTTEGRLLGHIVIGMQMVDAYSETIDQLPHERRLLLQHLIASHQGRPEWDSPRTPQTLEALVLHYADDLDAKMNQASRMLADVAEGEWSGYDRSFQRSFFRPVPPIERAVDRAPAFEDPRGPDDLAAESKHAGTDAVTDAYDLFQDRLADDF